MNKEHIFEILSRHCSEVVPELESYEFKFEDRLDDLGANSIDRSEILNMTIEALSLNIPRVELHGAKTMGEIVNLLYEKGK